MILPVRVERSNGQFAASLVGSSESRVLASSRAEALAALRKSLEQQITNGDIVLLEVGTVGVSELAGAFRDDPHLRDICREAYALRDQDVPE